MSKVFSVAAMALLVFVALGPATWQPRSGLGFELDHFAGYFVFTLMFCLAWPRPLAVGGVVVFALVLENCNLFYRIARPILWRRCTAQPGCWQRLCLLSSSFEDEGGLNQRGLRGTARKTHSGGRLGISHFFQFKIAT